MRAVKISTKEPIKITLQVSEHGNDHAVEITYKKRTYTYAYIDACTLSIDVAELRTWIEETYYNLDFINPHYIPCDYKQGA